MKQADVEGLIQVAEALVEKVQQHSRRHEQALDKGGAQHQRERDAEDGVHDAEDLAHLGQRRHMAIAYQ